MSNSIEEYIQRLRTTPHPEDMRRVVALLILALESPHAFIAQFDPNDTDHQCAADAAIELIDQFQTPHYIRQLIEMGVHESVSTGKIV